MKEDMERLRDIHGKVKHHLQSPPKNAKQFWLLCRDANEYVKACVAIYDTPHILSELHIACLGLKSVLLEIAPVVDEFSSLLSDGGPEAYSRDRDLFVGHHACLAEEASVIDFRLAHLRELLDGELMGDEPMSHEAMLNFIDTLAPVPVGMGVLSNVKQPIDERPDRTAGERVDISSEMDINFTQRNAPSNSDADLTKENERLLPSDGAEQLTYSGEDQPSVQQSDDDDEPDMMTLID